MLDAKYEYEIFETRFLNVLTSTLPKITRSLLVKTWLTQSRHIGSTIRPSFTKHEIIACQ